MFMIVRQSWRSIFCWICFAFQTLVFLAESYNIKCPSQAHWKFRAKVKCNSTMKYFCLFNSAQGVYAEGCNGPDWDRKGSKRIYAGDFSRGYCEQERFQPFLFWTNGSISDCIFTKSICSEAGQLVYKDETTKADRTCRCDYKKNYSFIKTPRNACACVPTEEDCSCYIKSCPVNHLLADNSCIQIGIIEYNKTVDEGTISCIENNPKCVSETTSSSKRRNTAAIIILVWLCIIFIVGCVFADLFPTWTIDKLKKMRRYVQRKHKGSKEDGNGGFVGKTEIDGESSHEPGECTPVAIDQWPKEDGNGGFVGKKDIDGESSHELGECTSVTTEQKNDHLRVGKEQPNVEDQKSLERWSKEDGNGGLVVKKEIDGESSHEFGECTSVTTEQKNDHLRVGKEQLNVEDQKSFERLLLEKEEVNYLRLIHLLFRVACPVVRMIFNHEIQPNQLRRTLDKNKRNINKLYRRKEKIISDYQWNLLFGHFKGKTVTSDEFGIRLMIYLLRILANIDVGDLYPVQSDTSIGAMLSRIKYTRNEVTQSLEGNISEDQFIKYWDDIGQAIMKCMSSLEMNCENCEHNKGLTDRLFILTPINIDTRDVCLFIDMSERFPDVILQKIISEYCTLKGETIKDILRNEKHNLYHKRSKTESCCKCNTKQVSSVNKSIPEKQWQKMYEIRMHSNSHSCPLHLTKCSESFVPKTTNTIDSSVIMTLLLHSHNMMYYIASRLFVKGFRQFLLDNQHTLYHSMDNNMCCKCSTAPTEKILFNKVEWNRLFIKATAVRCRPKTNDCCCLYSVRNEIEYSDIDETILFKLIYISSPFCVLNKIKTDAFVYFINWTLDVDPLRKALTELLEVIEDETFRSDMLQRISSVDLSQSDKTEAKCDDVHAWVFKHLGKQKATAKPPLHILLKDGDCLHVRSVQIPPDFNLPHRNRKFTDITSEENNFLVVVHGLSKIVYPVVINEFHTQCRHHILNAIRRDIFEQHCISPHYQDYDEHRERHKRMYLTQKQRDQLYSPQREQSSISDLKLMIYILRIKTNVEEKKDYIKHLDVIDEIRREIVQSSSGILNDERFKDIMERICEAVVYLGGKSYMEKLSNLQRIQNILGSDI